MKNTTILAVLGVVILLTGAFMFLDGNSSTGNVSNVNANELEGEVQKVVIGQRDLNYYPSEIKVKVNQPVEITLDNSVQGCLRSFTIKDFGISEYLPNPEDKVVFTPTKKGQYAFACSMGMGFGTIVVE